MGCAILNWYTPIIFISFFHFYLSVFQKVLYLVKHLQFMLNLQCWISVPSFHNTSYAFSISKKTATTFSLFICAFLVRVQSTRTHCIHSISAFTESTLLSWINSPCLLKNMSPFHLSFSLLFYIVLNVKAIGLYFPGSVQSLPGLRAYW